MFRFLTNLFRRVKRADKHYYRVLKETFGLVPNNIELYKLALLHRSASLFLDDGEQINNERLEFLGDAVLESIASDYLYIAFPHEDEGFLTQMRSKIVSGATLNELAIKIGLDKHLIANAPNGSSQKHIFGDALEAIVGAIYLDKGYNFVNRLVINQLFEQNIDINELVEVETDFKSRLIELCQRSKLEIVFDTKQTKESTSHAPTFVSHVMIEKMEMGYGMGESKKEAEQQASQAVWQVVSDEERGDALLGEIDKLGGGEDEK